MLTAAFPIERLRRDLIEYARIEGMLAGKNLIFFKFDTNCDVPVDCDIEIVAMVTQFDYIPRSTEIRIVLALGGVLSERNGCVTARYYLAKMYYDADGENRNLRLNRVDADY